jgi:V8-like Glu-specific endopeptidase
MIDQDLLRRVRSGVCAVGCLTVSDDEYEKSPWERGHFEVAGTGFLVRENTVATNRHVVAGMRACLIRKRLDDDRRAVHFTYPSNSGWITAICGVEFITKIEEDDLDLAFVDITRRPERDFDQCQALEINDDDSQIAVSREIAMFGFPGGNSMFVDQQGNSETIIRFGPILQQGHISALAPFDGLPISKILADIRTYKGMSGSPVFLPETGKVLSIHQSAAEPTTAYSIPIEPRIVEELLEKHDENRRNEEEKMNSPVAS